MYYQPYKQHIESVSICISIRGVGQDLRPIASIFMTFRVEDYAPWFHSLEQGTLKSLFAGKISVFLKGLRASTLSTNTVYSSSERQTSVWPQGQCTSTTHTNKECATNSRRAKCGECVYAYL